MSASIRWTVRDHYGNDIYLTHERWEHIVEPINHPEMSDFEGLCNSISKRDRVKV